jgi:hypothetical protein
MEPIPGDQTWKSTAIDVESTEVKWKFTAHIHAKMEDNM